MSVERQLLERQTRKGSPHRIVTGVGKWVHCNNPKRAENHGDCPVVILLRQHHGRVFMAQKSCVWWEDQLGASQVSVIERAIDAPEPWSRKKKNGHSTTGHDNPIPHVAKLVVKKYIETLKWEILPHPSYSPDVAPSDFAQWHTA
nr:transposase [Hymenolepis microstoma]